MSLRALIINVSPSKWFVDLGHGRNWLDMAPRESLSETGLALDVTSFGAACPPPPLVSHLLHLTAFFSNLLYSH